MYTLKITEVSAMDKTATNLARLRAYDENPWDESEHPRAENGRFTSGSSNESNSSSSESDLADIFPKGTGKIKETIGKRGTTRIEASNGDEIMISYNRSKDRYDIEFWGPDDLEANEVIHCDDIHDINRELIKRYDIEVSYS